MGKPHFHTCVNVSKHHEFYPLGLLQEEIFAGPTSFLISHWGLCPMGEFWCGFLLLLLPSGAHDLVYHPTRVWPFSFPVPSTLGPWCLSRPLIQKNSECRQKDYKRQKLVQVSVKPVSYSSVCLRPLESNDNPTGLGLSLQSHISPDNWVKQLVIPIARMHEWDDKGRLIYDHLVSERCSILFNK